MYEIVFVYNYPNDSIEPYSFPQEFYSYVQQNYANDRVYQEKSFSDDGLTQTTRIVWASKEAYDRYNEDATVLGFLEGKKQHNIDNGITWTKQQREIDSL